MDNDEIVQADHVTIYTWLVVVGGYWAMTFGFTFIEYMNPRCIRRYRINKNAVITNELVLSAVKLSAFNMFCVVTPGIFLSSRWIRTLFPRSHQTLPSLYTMCAQVAGAFVIDDLWFYVYHRLFHEIKPLYGRYHKIHHRYTVPFALSSNAVHPVELLFQAIGTLVTPIILQRFHIVTLWIWLVLRQLQGIEDHIGYAFPWSPTSLLDRIGGIPILGGARFHDWHHTHNIGNYASTFAIIDYALGTDRSYTKS